MRKSKSTIHNALPIVAAAYGEKFGVKVEVAGHEAHTDGKTIVVPNVPETYNMDVLWGYLAHEAAHVRFTDFAAPRTPGLHATLTNVLEDCRIERAMMSLYPGTAKTLLDVAQYMVDQGHYSHVKESDHPAQILTGYCLYWLQSQAVGQPCLTPYMQGAKQALEAKFPMGAVLRLNVLLRNAVAAQSTADASTIASQILVMIQEEAEKEQQKQQEQQASQDDQDSQNASDDQPPQGAGAQGDQDDQGSRDGQGSNQDDQQGQGDRADPSSQPQGEDGQDGQDSSASTQPQGSSGQDDDQGATATQASPGAGGQVSAEDGAKALQQVLSAGAGDLGLDAREALKAELFEAARQGGNPDYQTVRTGKQAHKDDFTGEALLNEVRGATSKIRAQLAGMVQASLRSSSITRRSGKRLDASKLHRAALGDSRVFLRPADKKRPNTAVHLLVDMSGSMNAVAGDTRRHFIARKAALALALALDAIPNVNPAVSFFGGYESDPVQMAVKHGESVQANAGRFGVLPNGGTPMASAIWYSAFALSKTREDRKMLIVITDGDPDSQDATEKAIELCERSDVEVIGIGVGTNSVRHLFDQSIVISDFDQLQTTLFKLMEAALVAA